MTEHCPQQAWVCWLGGPVGAPTGPPNTALHCARTQEALRNGTEKRDGVCVHVCAPPGRPWEAAERGDMHVPGP